jgi:hypothetical protein
MKLLILIWDVFTMTIVFWIAAPWLAWGICRENKSPSSCPQVETD